MAHLTCADCGSTRPISVDHQIEAIMEALRDHPDTQTAWVHSRLIADKGADLPIEQLASLLEEQERVEPNSLTDFYWSWIMTLGIGRAAVKAAKNALEVTE